MVHVKDAEEDLAAGRQPVPPELVLLDNLSLLDEETRARVLDLVLDRSLRMTVVIATTDERVAARCDETVRLMRVDPAVAAPEVSA